MTAAALQAKFQTKAFALLDALSGAGLNDSEIGAVLLGMAIPAFTEGGRTRDDIHKLVDKLLDERGAS